MSVKTGPRIALMAMLVAAGCSSGGGGSREPEQPPPIPSGQPFTLSGTVTYDFVPVTGTLAFASSSPKPVRNARLQVRQGTAGTVLQETTTGEAGTYSITFTPGASGALMVAVLAETVSPSIRVEDNTDGNAVWAVGKPILNASPTLDVHATHGWNGTAYVAANRIAAPFAILDSMYTAARRFVDLPDRTVAFPALKVNWSPANHPSETSNPATGAIGTSHYAPAQTGPGEIYILGQEGVDTDEFDSHVIVHEWGHYFEDNLSRSDSPGGPHQRGDVLDPRLAFGEGYGTALAAMLLSDPVYADTMWFGSTLGIGVRTDAETAPTPTDDFGAPPYASMSPGAFSEMTVLRVLYDLYDPANDDGVALGLAPIYDTLVGPQKSTDSLTTIASFIAGLKAQAGVSTAAVNTLLAAYDMGPIGDQWGTGDARLSAMFAQVGSLPYTVNVTLDGGYDGSNQWQWLQYFVVTGNGAQLTVSTFSTSDVGLEAFRLGDRIAAADRFPGGQTETMSFGSVNGAKYVIVLTGYEQAAINHYTASLSVTSP